MATLHTTNYYDIFIAVAEDCTVTQGVVPPPRSIPSVAELTHRMITGNPYRYTSDEVIFTVWAERNEIADADRSAARELFFSRGQPCLRSSDLGKRYGWGVHSNAEGRVAAFALQSEEYGRLEAGIAPDGSVVTVKRALRSSRPAR